MGPPEDSFTTFVRRWRRLVCEEAGSVLGPVADCEDVAQRVFVRLWWDGRWRSIARPAPYLRAAARREALSVLRRHRRRREVALGPELLGQLSHPARAHLDAVARRRELDWVADQISRMPRRCRAACTLVFLGGCTHAEAAERLGVGQKAVEKSVARGRRHLKEAVKAQRRFWVSNLSDGGGVAG